MRRLRWDGADVIGGAAWGQAAACRRGYNPRAPELMGYPKESQMTLKVLALCFVGLALVAAGSARARPDHEPVPVVPDHLLVPSHFEDPPFHAITDERVPVGESLGTGHEHGGEVGLPGRGPAE